MRHFLPLLAMPAALVVTVETAQALEPAEISQIAKPVTIHISVRTASGSNIGSGVIIKKEGSTYYVLTARHVLKDALEGYLFTSKNFEDGYQFNTRVAQIIPGVDLAVIQFTSPRKYPVAKFGDSEKLAEGNSVFVTGFPDAQYTDNQIVYRFVGGEINSVNSYPLDNDGYAWQYSNSTLEGMSGGGVFDREGNLVGIHGSGVREGRVLVQVNKAIPIAIYQEFGARATSRQNTSRGETSRQLALKAKESWANKDYEQAISYANQALKVNPNEAIAYNYRGNAKYALKDYQGAIADYSSAIEVDPNYSYSYNNRGAARSHLKNYQEAITDFSRAIEIDPKFAMAYTNRGRTKNKLKDYQGAINDFTHVIELDPNHTFAYNNRGNAYKNIGDYVKAIVDFSRAIELDPNFQSRESLAEAYHSSAGANMESGNYQRAIADYSKVVEIFSGHPKPYYLRGYAKFKSKDYEGAIADYKRVLELEPDYPDAYYRIGLAYKNLGNKNEALEHYRQAARLYKEQGYTEFYNQMQDDIRELEGN